MQTTIFIPYNERKYPCVLTTTDKGVTHIHCEAAAIDDEYDDREVSDLLANLPGIIEVEHSYREAAKGDMIRVRVSASEKEKIQKRAEQTGRSMSEFVRDAALGGTEQSYRLQNWFTDAAFFTSGAPFGKLKFFAFSPNKGPTVNLTSSSSVESPSVSSFVSSLDKTPIISK